MQDRLEAALRRFCTVPVTTLCAGRTDARVHALMQVVHFDTHLQRAASSWVRGPNTFLPSDIAVEWATEVPDDFHARGSALARRYVYILRQSPVRPAVDHGRVGWTFSELDETAMRAAAQHLIGRHDFSAFRAAGCQAKSPVKHMRRVAIRRSGAYWRFDFEADAFLHHMIRNIMGCLLFVGQGTRPGDWLRQVLESRNRTQAAPTFSADGLYFSGPVYDPKWGLPVSVPAYDWLP